MEKNTNSYIKLDNNTVINEKTIRWIKKIDDCLEICSKQSGCQLGKDTHKICNFQILDSYNKLNILFE